MEEKVFDKNDLEFFEKVVHVYESSNGSIRETSFKADLSRAKVRKILITMGVITSDITTRALKLLSQGKTQKETAFILGISEASLSTYLPYGNRIYNRDEKSLNAVRVENWRARQAHAAMNQVKSIEEVKKDLTGEVLVMKNVYKLHLGLNTEYADMEILKRYGRVRNGITRDILVPEDMTLYSLHYAIQRAFGWNNCHLHNFLYPQEVTEKLTADLYGNWAELCGIYFRFPYHDDEFEDIYWNDDYKEGQSVSGWFRKKYTGPYYYGGELEHYTAAQARARMFAIENPEIELMPSFEEYRAGKRGVTTYPVNEAPVSALRWYMDCDLYELLERLTVREVLGMKDAGDEFRISTTDEIIDHADEINKDFEHRYFVWMESERTLSDIVVEEPVALPMDDTLIYEYDYGDGWEVKISLTDVFTEAEGEYAEQINEVISGHKPVGLVVDGLNVMDDVGGIHGYCEFLKGINGIENNGPYEDAEDSLDWASLWGWNGRMRSAKQLL